MTAERSEGDDIYFCRWPGNCPAGGWLGKRDFRQGFVGTLGRQPEFAAVYACIGDGGCWGGTGPDWEQRGILMSPRWRTRAVEGTAGAGGSCFGRLICVIGCLKVHLSAVKVEVTD